MNSIRYTFNSTLEDEIAYVQLQIKLFNPTSRYNYRWPPTLEAAIPDGQGPELSTLDIRDAILNDETKVESVDDIAVAWNKSHADIEREFFNRIKDRVPKDIKVHVTKYGPGGSYHSLGASMLSKNSDAISIKDPKLQKTRISIVQNIVHETVELIIRPRVLNVLPHAQKEAVVDQICSCDQLKAIYGKYPKQTTFTSSLPHNWPDFIAWQENQQPTWSTSEAD